MTDYSGTPLYKKLGLKDGFIIKLVNPPDNYYNLFHEWPENIEENPAPTVLKDFIHLFVNDPKELETELAILKKEIKQNGMIWVSWPKLSSKIPSKVDGNTVRKTILNSGLVDVKVCSVDSTWSGQKAVIRIKDRV